MVLGIGFDWVEVDRLERALDREGESLAADLLTPAERAECARRRHPARHLAARFAAKEAVAKALALDGSLGTCWRWIEILEGAGGRPAVSLHGPLAAAAERRGVRSITVALHQTPRRAAAGAILSTEPPVEVNP